MKQEIRLLIPSEFQKINSMPGDPENSIVYGKQTSSANCFLILYPINISSAMPFDNRQNVIDGIHQALADDQGLIEVQSGMTKCQKKYIYSIVKTKLNPNGVQYILTMHIHMDHYVINIQAFFDEVGTTGYRDTFVLNKLMSEGKIIQMDNGDWRKDPYDNHYKKGFLMNLSEQPEYDEFFHQHPLSEIRRFIGYVLENN